jgi:hypothetical protein
MDANYSLYLGENKENCLWGTNMNKLLLKTITSLLLFWNGLSPTLLAKAEIIENKHVIIHKFVNAFKKNDKQDLKSLVDPSLKIPEIRENTPIVGIQGLPSPENDKMVLIGRFKEEKETGIQRIAFIWEVTVLHNRISNIRVVADAANPFMNEQIVFNEYKEKFKKEILLPTHFSFTVSHVNGKISGNKIKLNYINRESIGILQIEAVPQSNDHIKVLDDKYQPITIKNGLKGMLGKTPTGYEFIFKYDGMEYHLKIHEADGGSYRATKEDLLRIAESLNFAK